jgi:hypothetical protein
MAELISYVTVSRKPYLFRRFTGLTITEFNRLYQAIENGHKEYEIKRLTRPDRKNVIGQGRKFELKLIDRLILLLIYYRLYITFSLLGFLFGIDQSTVARNIRHLEPLVKKCIPLPEKIHRKVKRISNIDEFLRYFPDMKAFVDATEQEIPRPKNRRRRKSHYSGKKKRHTVKTQVITNKDGIIIHKTPHVNGRKHDYELFKRKHPPIPPDIEMDGDLGYQGIENDFPEIKSRIPIKKPKGGSLSGAEKKHNKSLSQERVVVEHVIGRMKRFRIMGDEFRNRLRRYDTMTSIVAGLVNFHVMVEKGFDMSGFVG